MPNSRVLLIDDDDLIAVALYEHLLANAIEVDLAREPAGAMDLMNRNRYALVVMDAYLTGLLHGRAAELLEQVSVLCPDARLILLSAYGSEELARSVRGVRAITAFSKPQSVWHLAGLIGGFLEDGAAQKSTSKR